MRGLTGRDSDGCLGMLMLDRGIRYCQGQFLWGRACGIYRTKTKLVQYLQQICVLSTRRGSGWRSAASISPKHYSIPSTVDVNPWMATLPFTWFVYNG